MFLSSRVATYPSSGTVEFWFGWVSVDRVFFCWCYTCSGTVKFWFGVSVCWQGVLSWLWCSGTDEFWFGMSVCGQGVLCWCCGAVVQLNFDLEWVSVDRFFVLVLWCSGTVEIWFGINECLLTGRFVLVLWCSGTVEFWLGMSVCGQGVLCWCCCTFEF